MNVTTNYEPRHDLDEVNRAPQYGKAQKFWPTFCVRCFHSGWQTDDQPRACPRCGMLLKVGT